MGEPPRRIGRGGSLFQPDMTAQNDMDFRAEVCYNASRNIIREIPRKAGFSAAAATGEEAGGMDKKTREDTWEEICSAIMERRSLRSASASFF